MNESRHPRPWAPDDRSDDDLTRGHRALFLLLGVAAAALALALAGGPDLQATASWWPAPWPALHRRCLAALAATAALPWLLALRERDAAAVRLPLVLALVGSATALLQTLGRWSELGPASALGWSWLLLQGAALLQAGRLLAADRLLHAHAERSDRPLAACGAALLLAAALLALAPELAARLWPWPLPRPLAALYASAAAAWGVVLGLLARERRRAGRRLALCGLVLMGPLVALASAWHHTAFHHPAAGLAWGTAALALSALCARRLRPGRFQLPIDASTHPFPRH